MKAIAEGGALDLLKTFESEFSCASMCDTAPLFYATKSIKDGVPTQSCSRAMLEAAAD